jgi:hypothetical protein
MRRYLDVTALAADSPSLPPAASNQGQMKEAMELRARTKNQRDQDRGVAAHRDHGVKRRDRCNTKEVANANATDSEPRHGVSGV